MNRKFDEKGIRTRIVILCRKDVLDKLNDPNRSKYIQDSGIELDWYQSVEDMTKSSLYKLIELRARNSLGREVDVFSEFFPPTINSKDAFKYLLDHTRYTPRDLIQLMNRIQAASNSNYLTEQTVREGVNSYSENYFLMEVKDSMVGMLDDEDIETSFQAIRKIGVTEFGFHEFRDEVPDPAKALTMINALYVAGAISNVERENGESFRMSKFRNPNSVFNEKRLIAVNPGLRKALMIHPPSRERKDDGV